MNDNTQAMEASDPAVLQGSFRTWLIGSLAFLGAGTSIIFCYAQVLISLMAPLFGFGEFGINIHLQAVFMWGFGFVTVIGLVRDRKQHNSLSPLFMGVFAVLVISGTLYVYYDIRLLILGIDLN